MYNQCVILEAIITCPLCGKQATEKMPENACQHGYVSQAAASC